jgi:two-component system sensor histidine kinase SenX3
MPDTDALQPDWRKWLLQRGWLLGALLVALGALAALQYYWIDEVVRAERIRARSVLETAARSLKESFDFEVTRAIATFALGTEGDEPSAVRYAEWQRRAPYPRLLLGVYAVEHGGEGAVLKALSPDEPMPTTAAWRADVARLVLPNTVVGTAGPRGITNTGSTGAPTVANEADSGAVNPLMWDLTVAGNPTFAFALNGGEDATDRPAPLQWGLAVFDSRYLSAVFLPELARRYIPPGLALDYEIRVIENRGSRTGKVIFSTESGDGTAPSAPDWQIELFQPRLDCFSLPIGPGPPVASNISITAAAYGSAAPGRAYGHTEPVAPIPPAGYGGRFRLSDYLTITHSHFCSPAKAALLPGLSGRWTLQVNYHSSSDRSALAGFKRRSVFLSAGVLIVLGLGLFALILLSERATALAQMRSELVLGVSHELRTPLTVIRVAADNLKKGMATNIEQAREYGQIIGTEALRLSDMVEDTLALAGLQSGRLVLNTTADAVKNLIERALAACEPALRDAGIEVQTDIAAALPQLRINTRLMSKCLENLIQNVTKYAAGGHWMALRARLVTRPEGRSEPQYVQISVEDRGPGISATDLPHIFEPFYRGSQALASRAGGLGLGLTFVKRVVEAHGGRMEVRTQQNGNRQGTGTEFSLFLRCHPLGPAADSP